MARSNDRLYFRKPRRRQHSAQTGYQNREMTTLRDEFRWRNLLLHHSDPSLFYTSQWRLPRPVFVAYRVLTALFCVVWMLVISVLFPSLNTPDPVWAYLTNWSFMVLTIHLTLAAVIACLHNVEDYYESRSETEPLIAASGSRSASRATLSDTDVTSSTHSLYADSSLDHIFVRVSPMPWYMKLDWILYNVNTFASLFVTIVFFVFLFPYMGIGLDLVDFVVHGVNSIFTVIEILFCAVPIRLLHFLYPALYAITYVIFSVIYWSTDRSRAAIYPILDWNNLGLTLPFLVGGLVGGLILWVILFLVARFRKWVFIRVTVDN